MSAVNKIIKYNLEERTRELNLQGKSTRDIADILSKESGNKINKDSVWTFLKSDTVHIAAVIEKKTELQEKAAEIEINVLGKRQEVIDGLLDIAKDKKVDSRSRIKAYEAARDALWSLDERLNILTTSKNGPVFNMNNFNLNKEKDVKELSDYELSRIIENGQ